MRAHWKKGLAALLAALLLLAALPLGTLAAPAGETGCSLQRTVEQLGGGAAGQSQAATFLAGANASADGSLYSQLTPRQQACYDALEAISIDQILTAAEKDGYRQVGVRIPELYGLTLTGEADGSGFYPRLRLRRQRAGNLHRPVRRHRGPALRPAGHPVDVGHALRVPLAAAERRPGQNREHGLCL